MELFEQKRVRLSELVAGAHYPGHFSQRPTERKKDFAARLAATTDHAKIAELVAAMKRGDKIPPVIVAACSDEYELIDGWHRCTSAARLGWASIPAVVFNVASAAEKDLISEYAFEGTQSGQSWVDTVRMIRAALREKALAHA